MRQVPLRLWLLAIVSAGLQLLPFPIAGLVPVWRRAFCWFCLVPLLIAVTDKSVKAKQAAWVGYACGVLWYAGNCYWIYQTMYLYGGLPKPVALVILFLFSLYLGLYLALFGGVLGWLASRFSRETALLVSPVVWVAVELARARVTGFPWDLLGYTQVDNLLMGKLAPVGGVMLLGFVVAAGNALFATAWLQPAAKKRLGFAVAGVLFAMGLQAGVLYHPAADATSASAVLLQENLLVGATGRSVERLPVQEKYRQFETLSKNPQMFSSEGSYRGGWVDSIPGGKSDLIVWPEAPADFATSDPNFLAQAGGLAKETATPVISGSVGVDFDKSAEGGYREYGSAAVFDKDGSYVGRYDKIHRVPWGEYVPYKDLFFFAGHLVDGVGNMSPGTQHSVFHLNGHTVGIFICYESIFGDEVREFVKNGADVLVNISDDGWYGDTGAPWQHLDMERMRAMENHRWILRDTNTGVTTAVDPHGRGIFTTPRHVRQAFVFKFGYLNDVTFYARFGDWFAWICAGVAVGLVIAGFGRKQRQQL